MTSTELSATGRFSISPSLNSTFVYFPFLAFALALSIISGVMSTPITLPCLPTLLAAKKQSKPAPAPKSRTRLAFFQRSHSSWIAAAKTQICPLGNGIHLIFTVAYHAAHFLTVGAEQQLIVDAQQEPLVLATLAYRFLTSFFNFFFFHKINPPVQLHL